MTTPLLCIAAAAVLLTGCSLQDDSVEPGPTGVATKLPQDTNRAESSKRAHDFRSWVDKHGNGSQQEAAARVQRIIGDWDENSGAAFISTDINGGPTQVKDPASTAETIVKTFTAYIKPQKTRVRVYDVFGQVLTGNSGT
ncbi:hypothetical protein PYK79_24160 [Streptomyces sp. ID05-04B]|uniref:hypothetical protein n=1 Tax=Streptomyces sp. ID05-04B TaxID=3028661 RepID=UPI0029C41809|nr:hypothetical protein [Streptomyces sp. ID05-04B]MDX5565795.1 hypothetical protein [Streptomyces sp. ID05-04B]